MSRSAAPAGDDQADFGDALPSDDTPAAPELPLGDFSAGGELARTPSRPMISRSAATPDVAPTAVPAPTASRSAQLAGSASTPASEGSTALAPAGRPMVSRVAQPEPSRPHLQLVRTESAPAQPTISRAAERLAGATGGALERGEGGLSTVHFPPPAGRQDVSLTHQPYTISRELADPAPAQSAPAQQSTGAEHPPSDEGGEKMDPEALYEYFLDRFKRDLLIEREQLGHLIIDNP